VKTAGDVSMKLTLEKVTDPAVSTNPFVRPAQGNRYIAFTFTVENIGQKEAYVGTFKLRTTDNFEYDRAIAIGVAEPSLDALQNLTSGGKTRGSVVFEIPTNAQVQWVKFDPNPFAKGDLYFDK
jgi:hypothetical protein